MEKDIEYRMVDLGLPSGLKWADRNVGAASPEAFGDYFMCGSTEPDTDNVCDWAHAPFNNGSENFDEAYFNEHKSEWLTEDGILKPEYDAAHVIMGDGWRMPTLSEIEELVECTNQFVGEYDGAMGTLFLSKTNGNNIFMPFCGGRDGCYTGSVGEMGSSWSSSHDEECAFCTHQINFSNEGSWIRSFICHYGFAVRGVHE